MLVLFVAMLAFVVGRCSAPDGTDATAAYDSSTTSTTWPPDEPHHLMLDEPEAFLTSLRDRLDPPITVQRVVFYPTSAFADVQDPDEPRHLDEYSFRDGALAPEATPVAAGRLEEWEDQLFTLEVVRAEVIRSVARRAVAEFAELENGELTHMVVSRSYEGPIEILVYVNDPIRGGSGFMRTDVQGEILDVSHD
jgi:hypothetical protein